MKIKTSKEKIGDNFPKTIKKVKVAKSTSKQVVKNSVLLGAIKESDNNTLTENGASTFKSTLNANLDFFAMGSALRTRPDNEVVQLFLKAFAEDELMAMKNLFYSRNVRGGQGERKSFRTIINYLGNNYPEVIKKNFENIAFFGRYDDLLSLLDTSLALNVYSFIKAQLNKDIKAYEKSEPISLLAKWLKSENTSSLESRKIASKIRLNLGWSPKQYRKTLSVLRAYSNTLEVKLCSNQWNRIDYKTVPSKANLQYRNAFKKHDEVRYAAFLESVKKGETKINAGTLYPYEIYDKTVSSLSTDNTTEALWNALPNYMKDSERNILVMADVSGSMSGRPMSISVSLAIYTAERNKGLFSNHYITFSANPVLQQIIGKTLKSKINFIQQTNVGYSTNLQAAFDLVLDTAVKNQLEQKDLPEQIVVISDMEFNDPSIDGKTNHQVLTKKFKDAGYEAPSLVYWNVNSHKNNVAAKAHGKGVILVSGASPAILQSLLSGKRVTPIDQMLETLNQETYNRVLI